MGGEFDAGAKREDGQESGVTVLSHPCKICGAFGCFGYGVSWLRGKQGIWYCETHNHLHDRRSVPPTVFAPPPPRPSKPADPRQLSLLGDI